MENSTLKPCPFCGGEAFINTPYNGGNPFVMCKKCGGAGPQSFEAVQLWNRRK